MKKLLLPLLFALSVAEASAQCSGNFNAGEFCGNSAAVDGLAKRNTATAMFDRAFCATNNSAVARVSGSWVCLASANNGVWITSAAGVPSISSTLPNAVQDNITRLGTIANIGAPLGPAFGGFGVNLSALSGVPLFAAGVPTFTGTNGTGTFVRTDSAALTGTPTAPTAAALTSNTQIATTAYSDAAVSISLEPGLRLSLTTGTPVMIADVAGATTVYCTKSKHWYVPIYNGTVLAAVNFVSEQSQTTTDTTKSPAAVAANKNYDVFAWNDAGTPRCTRGPAWTSDTVRSLALVVSSTHGVYLNNGAITNGPAAFRGTYLGTIRSNGSSTIDMKFGTSAAGGGEAIFGIWNAHNRVTGVAKVNDSTANWSYTSNTLRSSNNSTTNRISFVSGLPFDASFAVLQTEACNGNVLASYFSVALAFDGTTVTESGPYSSFSMGGNTTTGQCVTLQTSNVYMPQTGFHYIQGQERADGTNAVTFTGGSKIPDFGLYQLNGVFQW
jgi:hypothetical protein